MKTVKTIENAVRDEIMNGFVANNCEFSAYSITRNIRLKVNNAELEIADVDYEDIEGVTTQRIVHEEIKDLVHKICGVDDIVGFERKWNHSVHNWRGYFSWAPVDYSDSSIDDQDDVHPAVRMVGGRNVTSNAADSYNGVKANRADPNDPRIVAMLTSYFDSRFAQCRPATIDSAHGRMKDNPLSLLQIKDIAEKNGYKVKMEPGKSLKYATIEPGARRAFTVILTNN